MYLILNTGSTGTGKSTKVKEYIQKHKYVCVFDVQNEYESLEVFKGKGHSLPNKFRFIKPDIQGFINLIKALPKGYLVVIEEATGFIKGQSSRDFIKLVLSKRHLKLNFLINFHSLHRVPIDLVEFTDILILRKTGDLEKNVKDKFPEILKHWKEAKASPNKYFCKELYLSNLVEQYKNV